MPRPRPPRPERAFDPASYLARFVNGSHAPFSCSAIEAACCALAAREGGGGRRPVDDVIRDAAFRGRSRAIIAGKFGDEEAGALRSLGFRVRTGVRLRIPGRRPIACTIVGWGHLMRRARPGH